jgi:hypothetical protein
VCCRRCCGRAERRAAAKRNFRRRRLQHQLEHSGTGASVPGGPCTGTGRTPPPWGCSLYQLQVQREDSRTDQMSTRTWWSLYRQRPYSTSMGLFSASCSAGSSRRSVRTAMLHSMRWVTRHRRCSIQSQRVTTFKLQDYRTQACGVGGERGQRCGVPLAASPMSRHAVAVLALRILLTFKSPSFNFGVQTSSELERQGYIQDSRATGRWWAWAAAGCR